MAYLLGNEYQRIWKCEREQYLIEKKCSKPKKKKFIKPQIQPKGTNEAEKQMIGRLVLKRFANIPAKVDTKGIDVVKKRMENSNECPQCPCPC